MKPGWKWLSAACVAASPVVCDARRRCAGDADRRRHALDGVERCRKDGVRHRRSPSNTLALELAYATKTGKTDLLGRRSRLESLANVSIADVSSRITARYRANPGRMNMPVVGVIWVDMVWASAGAKGLTLQSKTGDFHETQLSLAIAALAIAVVTLGCARTVAGTAIGAGIGSMSGNAGAGAAIGGGIGMLVDVL